MKTTTNIIYSAFALFALACFALSPATDAQCLQMCDSGLGNTAFGVNALPADSGNLNTAIGDSALFNNTAGVANTAIGFNALVNNTTGNANTALGSALIQNTTGTDNTASGWDALSQNTTGSVNTANGYEALFSNTTGAFNTATGSNALQGNTTGTNNTATGVSALYGNTTGYSNTAMGSGAMEANTTGFNNTATGIGALVFNTTGSGNTATGQLALRSNGTGNNNIAMGQLAGYFITGSNNIDIGNAGTQGESNKIRIGTNGTHTNTYIAGINGVTVANGVGVIIDTRGHLGTVVSSERFKENVQPMDKASEAILALKPVTFRYKHDLDPDGIPQFGLVAEDVEKVNPDLVARDDQGKPYTVRYEAVNAMLLNEFLKEHRNVELQDRKEQEQQKEIDALKAELKEQKALIQKVSAQLAVSKPTQQTVANNQ